MDCSAYFIDNV